jgi:hypothetical protein
MTASIHRARKLCISVPDAEPGIVWAITSGKPQSQEDIAMFARKSRLSSAGRSMTLATVAALALTAIDPSMALAAPTPGGKGAPVTAHERPTDVSAKRKVVRHRRASSAGAAAAAAAFAGIVGTGIAIAAARSRRDYYDDYGYYGGPGYYGGAPYYYGGYGGYRGGAPYYRGYPPAGW